jgi:FlaA1/EpsC-like NDP-sugar epimerase
MTPLKQSAMTRFIRRYLSLNVLPIWSILLIDMLIVVFSCLLGFSLRNSFSLLVNGSQEVQTTILVTLIASLISFRLFKTYSSVLRFSSFVDIMRIFLSVTITYAVILIFTLIPQVNVHLLSTGAVFIAYIVNVALMICSRVMVKVLFDLLNTDHVHCRRVFIYGAREAGVNIAKGLRIHTNNRYMLKGFIADEPELVGKIVMGVPVYMNDEHIMEVLEEQSIDAVIVSPKKMGELKHTDLVDQLLAAKMELYTATELTKYDDSETAPGQLKKLDIEDLLQRDPIVMDTKKISQLLEGKRVMITGAAGSIGSEIMRQVAAFNPYQMILVDQAETPLHNIRLELQDRWRNLDAVTIIANISNATRMEMIFKEYRPQYIFHAAAYKQVPMMEDNVSESIQTNIQGTHVMADLAVKYGCAKFVMISTDKAVNPTNVMGCSKRICEIYVQSLAKKLAKEGNVTTQFITTRFGNVLGSNGSVIPRFREQIERGGPVTVTHPEIVRYFMTIPEASRLVLEAGAMGKGGEIYIFDMGKPVKIVDLARRMIHLSGHPEIKIEFTGLRHGEKLYEELLNNAEQTKPTYHDKIKIANVREYCYEEVKHDIDEMIKLSFSYDQMQIVAAMKKLVPEFISMNSYFEVLDAK